MGAQEFLPKKPAQPFPEVCSLHKACAMYFRARKKRPRSGRPVPASTTPGGMNRAKAVYWDRTQDT
jgi:hypothetical protein